MSLPAEPQSRATNLDFGATSAGARLLGDRWTLMIVREMLCGARRFNEIHRRMPTLSRSMLAGRLRNLQRMGAVHREPIPGTTLHEYLLTPAGEALREVLESVGTWTTTWQLSSPDPIAVPELLSGLERSLKFSSLPQPKVCIEFQFANSAHPRGWLHAESRHSRTHVDGAEPNVDLVVSTRPQVLDDLWHGRRTCEQTIAAGEIAFAGPGQLVQGFRHWFERSNDD